MPHFLFNDPTVKGRRKRLRRESTPAEIALWRYLRNRQFHGLKFRRQHSIGPYIVDFYCAEAKIAIEIDGDSHFLKDALRYDRKRGEFIARHGVSIIRFLNTEVLESVEGVLQVIEQKIRRYTYLPSSSA